MQTMCRANWKAGVEFISPRRTRRARRDEGKDSSSWSSCPLWLKNALKCALNFSNYASMARLKARRVGSVRAAKTSARNRKKCNVHFGRFSFGKRCPSICSNLTASNHLVKGGLALVSQGWMGPVEYRWVTLGNGNVLAERRLFRKNCPGSATVPVAGRGVPRRPSRQRCVRRDADHRARDARAPGLTGSKLATKPGCS